MANTVAIDSLDDVVILLESISDSVSEAATAVAEGDENDAIQIIKEQMDELKQIVEHLGGIEDGAVTDD